ncbi:MAG: glycoside hydrolase family 15 protein [Rhodospirillales bacterium]|nr:MAG: glycoside hydrolase family 15 protein [Rhodospirillales bacterium]
MAYQPIENYGMIGDLHTVALVGINGSIDWLCLPNFASPSVFAAILDDEKGGRFRIAPAIEDVTYKQFYWPETNVLVTRFLTREGAAELTDFMPLESGASAKRHHHRVVRRLTVNRGELTFRLDCRPAFDYGRARHVVRITSNGVMFNAADLSLGLTGDCAFERSDGNGVSAAFTLCEGETAVFVLELLSAEDDAAMAVNPDAAEQMFRDTVAYWRNWLGRSQYGGRWREMVHRSALALKLLTYAPTGAIVAAPTCSLPEGVGGERNWDYRYAWVRDAAFTVYAFIRLGFTTEAEQFMGFLDKVCKAPKEDGPLQLMYGIDGGPAPPEQILDHLEGYRGSRPIRIGNDARNQFQLDIYGELLDAVYLFNKHVEPISYDLWTTLHHMIEWVCEHWQRPDDGIWEVRSGRRQFVYSKLMCWVALDRGIRLADKRSFPANRARWLKVRDDIYNDIMQRGWNGTRRAFVQHYDGSSLDASNLMMPLTFFVAPTDPRMLATLDAILAPPDKGGLTADNLVYRYSLSESADGVQGDEGTFNICTFWLVEALTRAGRHDPARLEEARLMFERMTGYANHVGLYAEETGSCGEALGNYPQAFTHLALISAAVNLDRALGPGT